MDPTYRDAIDNARAALSQALLKDMLPTLLAQGWRLDALGRDILRAVGLALLSVLYQGLCAHLVERATHRGLTVQSRPIVRFKILFGEVEIESPYLRHPQSGESARPMQDALGVEGEPSSEAVQRALVGFGSDKSFARVALSCHDHYGWQVGRTTLRNRTLEAAREAEIYIDLRLQEATRPYSQSVTASPGVDTMVLNAIASIMAPITSAAGPWGQARSKVRIAMCLKSGSRLPVLAGIPIASIRCWRCGWCEPTGGGTSFGGGV